VNRIVKKDKLSPSVDMLKFERDACKKGFRCIAGVDEAGRGCLAGPVVASAVVLPQETVFSQNLPFLSEINDSKKLSAKKRDSLYRQMISCDDIQIGIGVVPEGVIDRINIHQASFLAMRKALGNLPEIPELILVDGVFSIPEVTVSQIAIIGGDGVSVSIAAASIVAKVVRDSIMLEYDKKYPQYGFKEHKGYGTRVHNEQLKIYGPSQIHRRSYEPVRKLCGIYNG